VGPVSAVPDPVLVAARAMVFVDDPADPVLNADDTHHLFDVLRLRPGELVVASDGAGSWAPCRVAGRPGAGRGADRDGVLAVDGDVSRVDPPRPVVTVAFVPAKGDRPEWVVQKLTEVGVDRIIPLVSGRSVVRWEGDRAVRAAERLRRVAREASAQSRRVWLPEVTGLTTVDGLAPPPGPGADPAVSLGPGADPAVPPGPGGDPAVSLGPAVPPVPGVVLAHPGGGPPSLACPVIAVGPEGGWTEEEVAGAAGTVGLGPTVLRAETAALVAGAILCALRSGVVGPLA